MNEEVKLDPTTREVVDGKVDGSPVWSKCVTVNVSL